MKSRSDNLLRRSQPLLGTFVEISVGGAAKGELLSASSEAFQIIKKVQALMSFHDPQSDVSHLNRYAFQHSVRIHPWTYRALETARKISSRTNGIFDITVAPLLIRWGYLPRLGDTAVRPKGRRSYFRDIHLLSGNRVRFHRPLFIDMGGIAKGFAVDQAVNDLKRKGVPCGIVNAGGDLKIFGETPQPVYVRRPDKPSDFIFLGNFCETALATSSNYFSKKRWENRWVSPIINTQSREPSLDLASVTVTASSCIVADALTKVVRIAKNESRPFLKFFSARAIIVQKSRTHSVIASPAKRDEAISKTRLLRRPAASSQ